MVICNNKKKSSPFDNIIWFLTVVLFASFSIWGSNIYISYILFGITLCIFGVTVIKQRGKIVLEFDSFHQHVLAISIFCIISAVWAWNSSNAISKGVTIFEILVCFSMLYMYYRNDTNVSRLLNAVKWSGYVVTIYAFMKYGFTTISDVINTGSRLENGFNNINSIALVASISLVIAVFQIVYGNRNISHLLCLPCVLFIAVSGTRKAIIFVVVSLTYILIQRFGSKNVVLNILKIIVVIGLLFSSLLLLSKLEIFQGVTHRMAGIISLITGNGVVESSAEKRFLYSKAAFDQFLNNPILGIGIDNCRYIIGSNFGFETYAHNNYAELLCDGGIVGFVIYYSMHVTCLKKLRKYKKCDPLNVICIALILSILFNDIADVGYYAKMTYAYFMIFFLQIKSNSIFAIERRREKEHLGGSL